MEIVELPIGKKYVGYGFSPSRTNFNLVAKMNNIWILQWEYLHGNLERKNCTWILHSDMKKRRSVIRGTQTVYLSTDTICTCKKATKIGGVGSFNTYLLSRTTDRSATRIQTTRWWWMVENQVRKMNRSCSINIIQDPNFFNVSVSQTYSGRER